MSGKSESHKALDELGNKILSNARNELFLSMRFLSGALSSLPYKSDQRINTIGTDGNFIYYNTMLLCERFKENPVTVNRLYLHQLLHCIFGHPYLRCGRDSDYWELACNIAAECLIDSIDEPSVKALIPEIREDLYQNLRLTLKVPNAEQIYNLLFSDTYNTDGINPAERNYVKYRDVFNIDDHSYFEHKEESQDNDNSENQNDKSKTERSGNKSRPPEKNPDRFSTDIKGQKKWEHIRDLTKTSMETFYKNAGHEHGLLQQSMKVSDDNGGLSYDSFLKKFAAYHEKMCIDPDSFDYGLYSYGMSLYKNMPIIEPLEYREEKCIKSFVICIDTSGSMLAGEIKDMLSLTFNIISNSTLIGLSGTGTMLHIIQADTVIHSDVIIGSSARLNEYRSNFILYGNGGTDFRPAFEYVENELIKKRHEKVSGLLYMTDGYGIFPQKRPSFKCAFVFLKENMDIKVPPYAMKYIAGIKRKDFMYVPDNEKSSC